MGSRANGTNPRAVGTNPRSIAPENLEKFPVTPIKARPRERWYAGKRYADGHIEIVWARWEECKHLFQFENHSRVRGFWRKQDAESWVHSLPKFSNVENYAEA